MRLWMVMNDYTYGAETNGVLLLLLLLTHRSIRGAYLSQSRAEKSTNAIQYTGMLEVVQYCIVITQIHEICFYAFLYTII